MIQTLLMGMLEELRLKLKNPANAACGSGSAPSLTSLIWTGSLYRYADSKVSGAPSHHLTSYGLNSQRLASATGVPSDAASAQLSAPPLVPTTYHPITNLTPPLVPGSSSRVMSSTNATDQRMMYSGATNTDVTNATLLTNKIYIP